MKLQAGLKSDGSKIWLLLDEEYRPVEPVMKYLQYLESVGRSPNTVKAYGSDLRLFWEFLDSRSLSWQDLSLEELSEFSLWLRYPAESNVVPIHRKSIRTERTINRILGTVSCFYEFHEQLNSEGLIQTSVRKRAKFKSSFKPLLHHISKGRASKRRLIQVKEPKRFPGCLSEQEISLLIEACGSIRDKFLICLLYETGLRIGEALSLYHEDLESGTKNVVRVVPREHADLRLQQKNRAARSIDVSVDLMKLYSKYLIEEYPSESYSDYVFVRAQNQNRACLFPLGAATIQNLFRRLEKKTGIHASPPLLRHTHATELIRSGWNIAYVQKRLGHRHIQTTLNTYAHLNDEDLSKAYRNYLSNREERGKRTVSNQN